MKSFKPTLEHIDQHVIAIRIGGHQEEPILQYKVRSIADNSLNHLVVVEINPHPEPLHHRCMFMKMQGSVLQVSLKRLDEKDRLRVLGWHLLHLSLIHI